MLEGLNGALQAIPMPVFAVALALLAWGWASRGLAPSTPVALAFSAWA